MAIPSFISNTRFKSFPRDNQRTCVWSGSTLNLAPSSHSTLKFWSSWHNLREYIDEIRGRAFTAKAYRWSMQWVNVAWGWTCFTNAWNTARMPIIDSDPSVLLHTHTHVAHSSVIQFCPELFSSTGSNSDGQQFREHIFLFHGQHSGTDHRQAIVHKTQHQLIYPAEARSRGLLSFLRLLDPKCPRFSRHAASHGGVWKWYLVHLSGQGQAWLLLQDVAWWDPVRWYGTSRIQ